MAVFLSQPGTLGTLLMCCMLVLADPPAREGKSLQNTFPFNLNKEHHDHHEEQDTATVEDTIRESKQGTEGNGPNVDFLAVATVRPGKDGKRCVNKVVMVKETVYDDVLKCDHSYNKRCHTTYITTYDAQQVEECEENFKKTCQIDYEKIAFNETVNICRTPLIKDCNCKDCGKEICSTQYESECWTKQEEHEVQDDIVECRTEIETKCEDEISGYTTSQKCSNWPKEKCSVTKKNVKKYTPVTGCTKEPREICIESGCGLVPATYDECYDKIVTVVQDAPKEDCTLEPQRTCEFVTKLVPKLEPKLECVDIPKEVCSRSRTNPRQVNKPIIKKWCYVPSEESGLD